jgi:hypothetical protein
MRQTFIGRILAVTSESVIMSTVDPSRSEAIALRAGAVIRTEAARLKGHVVRYTAEVSERTKCLSNPKFCIGSEYGLRAVLDRSEEGDFLGEGRYHLSESDYDKAGAA